MWEDFEQLFEERGGPKSCWCMVWRAYAGIDDLSDKAARKTGMRDRIKKGEKVGLIAFLNAQAVGWCSVGSRETFKRSLDGAAPLDAGQTWSLTCLFVKREYRGNGLSVRLIETAIEYARSQGAAKLDAYPVDPESPSYRFCGFKPQFDRQEFATVGKVGSRRYLVRRTL
ncbi:MAG: GNAT family N-acetyltransferase [Pseudomonadota bacterium]